jgi:pimeloyl-ACP methyl ester carboxylesterase
MKTGTLAFLALFLAGSVAAAEAPYRLAPYKDELFAYHTVLESGHEGGYRKVEYDRMRDLIDRDAVVGEKVEAAYVSLEPQAAGADLVLELGGATIRYVGVGATDGAAKAIVIFVHGRGTDRFSGTNDWIHGGNFNRIKNLMVQNGGLYLSPSFPDFNQKGADTVAALLLHYAALSPDAPVFLACASWGGKICWRLVGDPGVGPLVSGLIFLDSDMNEGFIERAKRLDPAHRVPIHISNSMGDKTIGWRGQRRFFLAMKEAVPDYPVKFVLFSAGSHGISMRMTDWRETINWMLSVNDGLPE